MKTLIAALAAGTLLLPSVADALTMTYTADIDFAGGLDNRITLELNDAYVEAYNAGEVFEGDFGTISASFSYYDLLEDRVLEFELQSDIEYFLQPDGWGFYTDIGRFSQNSYWKISGAPDDAPFCESYEEEGQYSCTSYSHHVMLFFDLDYARPRLGKNPGLMTVLDSLYLWDTVYLTSAKSTSQIINTYSLEPVPVPPALALMPLGLGALGVARRRARQARG